MAEINIQDATVEWLDQYFARFRVSMLTTTPRTANEALRWFLGEALGNVSVSDLTRSKRDLTFSTHDLNPESVRALLDTTLVDGDLRYVFSGLDTVMHYEPYSEPSPYIEVSFTVAK